VAIRKADKCKKGKSHHFILDDTSLGTCKYCGYTKQFQTQVETNIQLLGKLQFNPGTEKVSW
jgi:hypothetical protein